MGTNYSELEWGHITWNKSGDKLLGIRVGTNYKELEWGQILGIRVGTHYLELE